MLQTVRAEKVDDQNGFSCRLSKKGYFLQFCADLSKKSKSVKAIYTYIHLKALITLFQKMLWIIGVLATVHEKLAIKILKKMLAQQKFNKILRLQTLISPKQKVIA